MERSGGQVYDAGVQLDEVDEEVMKLNDEVEIETLNMSLTRRNLAVSRLFWQQYFYIRSTREKRASLEQYVDAIRAVT